MHSDPNADTHQLPESSIPEADRGINGGIFDKTYSAAACIASKKGSIYHRKVYGTPTFPPPHGKINFQAVFDLASLTKPLATSLACMHLASKGRIDLASPVSRVLKDFKADIWQTIKLEHLLEHSSGLPAYVDYYQAVLDEEERLQDQKQKPLPQKDDPQVQKNEPSIKPLGYYMRAPQQVTSDRLAGSKQGKEFIRNLIQNQSLEYETGSKVVYSDIGFMVLAFAVEEITRLPLNIYCEREIYKPLGITDLFFNDMTAPQDRLAARRIYVATEDCPWRKKLLQGEVHDPNAWAMGGVAGHAGLFGTVDAVHQLAQILLQAYDGDHPFFHSGTVRRFWTKSQRVTETTYALGWDTPSASGSQAGRRISLQSVGHLGFTGCSLWIDYTKGIINVFLANAVHPTAEKKSEKMKVIRPRVHDYLFKAADLVSEADEEAAARGASAFGSAYGGGSAAFGNPLRKPGG